MSAVHLARIDPARNMCRFYRLDVQPDLFGGFTVVKEWGRIGARGRMMDEWHMTEGQALAALQRQAERKRRRGYQCECRTPNLEVLRERPLKIAASGLPTRPFLSPDVESIRRRSGTRRQGALQGKRGSPSIRSRPDPVKNKY
jgi:predicted DNA-binding WGR domain protein